MAKAYRSKSGFWILIVAAVVLEATALTQYIFSRNGLREEAIQRAQSELKRAELEIKAHTVELEVAAMTLAMLAEKNLNVPDSIYAATRDVVATVPNTSSVAVAFVPDYFPKHGRYFEACSSRISEDSIYTRQIGSAEHNYTHMEWFQNGLEIDSCWWSEPYLDDSGSRAYVVSCSYPVRDASGKVVAVVCVDLSLEYLQSGVSEYLRIYPGSYYSITSGTGVEIVPIGDTIPGRKYIKMDTQSDDTGWKITIVIPDDVVFAELNRIGRIILILQILGLALLVFIMYRAGVNIQKLITVNSQKERMENELEIAQTIQMAMLPKVFPPFLDRPDLNIYGMVRPAKEIGGDLYDFYIRHDKLFFCVGDVSGKGVPAALVMATTRSLFRSVTEREERAAEIVKQMNDAMAEQNTQSMFVTLFLGVLDMHTGELQYCNAGHNAPVLLSDEASERTENGMLPIIANLPLGIMADFEYQAQTTKLQYNETLFLYTDGLTEAENEQHAQYGEERMLSKLAQRACDRPRDLVMNITADVESFVNGAAQSDDLTMLALRYQIPAIVMRNDIQQIPTLAEWVDELGIPMELNMPVNLALEEAVSNVMLYAYPDTNNGKVFVEFTRNKDKDGSERIMFTISDTGIPFDPTKQKEADITLSAEERAIGGLGIHLVRQLMDEVTYHREEEKNILTLVKKLKKEA